MLSMERTVPSTGKYEVMSRCLATTGMADVRSLQMVSSCAAILFILVSSVYFASTADRQSSSKVVWRVFMVTLAPWQG